MKKLLILFFFSPMLLSSQFENRTNILAGSSLQLTTQGHRLYNEFIIGGETILGFRIGKIGVGLGAGLEYTGSDYHYIADSVSKINLYNIDVPLFIDFIYGKKFYFEAKLGYSYKLSNIKEYLTTNTETLFNSLGFGYSFLLSETVLLNIAIEGKFDYLFTNTINSNYTSIYFLPLAKIGLRFTKGLE